MVDSFYDGPLHLCFSTQAFYLAFNSYCLQHDHTGHMTNQLTSVDAAVVNSLSGQIVVDLKDLRQTLTGHYFSLKARARKAPPLRGQLQA